MSEPRHDQSGTEELREMLREWRMEQALKRSPEEGQRAFRVFHDTTLDEICIRKPRSKTALSEISRFGKKTDTYQKYATGVVKVVNDWAESRSAVGLRLDDYSYEDGGVSFGGMLGESPWAKILWELYDSFSGGDPGIARRQIRERTGCDARAVRSVLQRMEGLGFFNAESGDGRYLLDPTKTRVKRLIMGLAQMEGGHREKAVQRRIEHFEKMDKRWIQWNCVDPHCDEDHCPKCGSCDCIPYDGHVCHEKVIEDAKGSLGVFDQLEKSGKLEGDEGAEAVLKAVVERVEGELEAAKARVLTEDAIALTLDAYLDEASPGESPPEVSRADLFKAAQSRGFSGSSARFSQILTTMEKKTDRYPDVQISREEIRDKAGRIERVMVTMEAKLWTARRRRMEQDRLRPGTKRWREEVAENNPSAYEPWEVEEDDLLRSRVAEGWSVEDLAEAHGRRPGAIRSRIRKLDLEG